MVQMILFIDPWCRFCSAILKQAQEMGISLRTVYLSPPWGPKWEEAVGHVTIREIYTEKYLDFVWARQPRANWHPAWNSWWQTVEEMGLDKKKLLKFLPTAKMILSQEIAEVRVLGVPNAPALWDGKLLRVGTECLDDYLDNSETI